MKKYLVAIICWMCITCVNAQDMFWSFDDAQSPLPIPAECDAKFDEVRGGVFTPTTDEMYEYGMAFIKNDALSVQQQGAYCLLGAALQGHPDAQLEVAKLYEEGRVLPQNDLGAYKWAFIAALNGNKQAEKVTLMLEQLLTTADLELTTGAINDTRIQIQQNLQQKLEEERRQAEEERARLEGMDGDEKQIQSTLETNSSVVKNTPTESIPDVNDSFTNIFDESDRMR